MLIKEKMLYYFRKMSSIVFVFFGVIIGYVLTPEELKHAKKHALRHLVILIIAVLLSVLIYVYL